MFLGHIKTWNDLRIQRINPDLKLPSTEIVLVVRQDGSGTTYAFTNHLSAVSSGGSGPASERRAPRLSRLR
jgi:phosphate transport system substrate-binding protein